MKIVEIIPQLASGGGERFTVDLCNELAQKHEVTLVVYFDIARYGFYARELSPAVRLICLNKKKGFSLKFFSQVAAVIREQKPDIAHLHLRAIMYVFPSILFGRGVRYCMTVHNAAEKEAGGLFGSMIRKWCFRRKLVTPVTISEESRKSFLEYYGTDAPMIFNGRNIPDPLSISDEVRREFDTYRKTPRTKVLVNLARIDPVKRQDMLARVARRLAKEGYDFTLLLIGGVRNRQMMEAISTCACPDVRVLGEKRNPLEYLGMADAYCLCSSYEGMPISLIEALGVGAVPVCTPVGGIVDVVEDGKNGFLAKGLDEEDCYELLKRFLEVDDRELSRLKQAAKKSYTPFSMTECAEKYVELFKSFGK